MKRAFFPVAFALSAAAAFGQTASPPQFEIADVHVGAKTPNAFFRNGGARGGRFELKNATMVDLIRVAYDYGADKVLGGPSWLELDRFDVTAKIPSDSTPETQKQMLQSLLADRFKLVVRKDTRPLPTYALTLGKKLQLKEAVGTEDPGCRPEAAAGPPAEGGTRLMMNSQNGVTTTINLRPGMTIRYQCRNITMAAFAEGLRGMMGTDLGPNPVLDQTGLKGSWNFDVKWSIAFMGPMGGSGDRITVGDAVEKQLGLKLEQPQIPTPVILVDSVSRKPSDNPPGVAEALPPTKAPTEFEVADVKPTGPDGRMGPIQMRPGGRFTSQGRPLRFLIMRAFNSNNADEIVGIPNWAQSDRYDITAKAPESAALSGPGRVDFDTLAPMIRALLVDRFKMTYHTEERPVTTYSLVAGKPKMKKADPASRTSCRDVNAPAGSAPGSRTFTCQNITMAEFADQLQNLSPQPTWPILDGTGIEGGWDFTLTFSMMMSIPMGPGRGGGGDAGLPGSPVPNASEPVGGYTIFEAVEKQLGLKLEAKKRPMPVIVIDHLEQKPTEN